jgi:hypothetical protein
MVHIKVIDLKKISFTSGIVVRANLCVRRPLEVKGKGIRKVGGVADKDACTVHSFNFSQRQYFVARCLSSYVGNVFGTHSTCVCFPFTRKLVT